MKIAWILDNTIFGKSFYVKNGKSYGLIDDKPYVHEHFVSSECSTMAYNLLWLWGEGYYIRMIELEEAGYDLPDLDLDLVFYSCERNGLDPENHDSRFSVNRLQKKYPKAQIIGYIKEWGKNFPMHRPDRFENRIKFFDECGTIHLQDNGIISKTEAINEITKRTKAKLNLSNYMHNIDYYYDNFYSEEKNNCIFAYLPRSIDRRGRTYKFAEYIGKKYNIEVIYKPISQDQDYNYLSLEDFIKLWSPCLYHFNLDPRDQQPGWQCIQVASVGSIHIGGLNESHQILYPETATNDESVLEEKFLEYFNNPEKRSEAIKYAWDKLNEQYSFTKIKSQLQELYGKK
tara:strand:+ start:409 stop:1440 length:1032 start_codon:yes stop_codon:yes gene_type:complete